MQLKATRLGEMLLEAGLIDQFQLESALSMQRNLGGRIGSALVKLGYLPEETILEFLESQSKFSRIELQDLDISSELLALIPAARMKHLLVVPIEIRKQGKDKILRVAMTDPTNLKLIDDLQFSTGCQILPVLAAEDEIRQALKKNLPPEPAPPSQTKEDFAAAFKEFPAFELEEIETKDPRLDRLLQVLKDKGILSVIDVERIKFD